MPKKKVVFPARISDLEGHRLVIEKTAFKDLDPKKNKWYKVTIEEC